jgi:hypothetical protein
VAGPITLAGFTGSAQAPDPRLLAESVGTLVLDAYVLAPGDLRPLMRALAVASVPAGTQRRTIYRLGADAPSDANYWFQWTSDVSVRRGFDGNDATERIYYTGNGGPKWTNNAIGISAGPPYPQGERELSVPAPLAAPIVTLNTDGTGTQGDVFYVQTFVNDLGLGERAVAAICRAVRQDRRDRGHQRARGAAGRQLRHHAAAHLRDRASAPRTTRRSSFCASCRSASTTTQDDARARGDVIVTIGWLPPPATAKQLLDLWNEMFAAIDGKNIIFCEPGEPYAWPVKYDTPGRAHAGRAGEVAAEPAGADDGIAGAAARAGPLEHDRGAVRGGLLVRERARRGQLRSRRRVAVDGRARVQRQRADADRRRAHADAVEGAAPRDHDRRPLAGPLRVQLRRRQRAQGLHLQPAEHRRGHHLPLGSASMRATSIRWPTSSMSSWAPASRSSTATRCR